MWIISRSHLQLDHQLLLQLPSWQIGASEIRIPSYALHMLEFADLPKVVRWVLSVWMARKKDSVCRSCGNCHVLNVHTIPGWYQIHTFRILIQIWKVTIFSKINLIHAFHHVLVVYDDILKAEVIMPFRLFKFIWISFNLINAAYLFQWHLNFILRHLDFIFLYHNNLYWQMCWMKNIKDISDNSYLISMTFISVQENVFLVFWNFCPWICINKFGIYQCKYKLLLISTSNTVDDLLQIVKPSELLLLFSFWFSCYTAVTFHLNNSFKKRDKHQIDWNDATREAWLLEARIGQYNTLAHPSSTLPLVLSTDESDSAIGVILNKTLVLQGKTLELLGLKNKITSPQICSTSDHELLVTNQPGTLHIILEGC